MKAREPGFDVENRDSRYDPGKKRAPVDLGILYESCDDPKPWSRDLSLLSSFRASSIHVTR